MSKDYYAPSTRLRMERIDGKEAAVVGDADSLRALLLASQAQVAPISGTGQWMVTIPAPAVPAPAEPKQARTMNWHWAVWAAVILAGLAIGGAVAYAIVLAALWVTAHLAAIVMTLAILFVATLLLGGGGAACKFTVTHHH